MERRQRSSIRKCRGASHGRGRAWYGLVGGVVMASMAASGCAGRGESPGEQSSAVGGDLGAVKQAATATTTLTLTLPSTIGPSNAVLAATRGMALADRASIEGGYVVNTGTQELNIGVDARFRMTHTISRGLVRARGTNDPTAWIEGSVVTSSVLVKENNAQVGEPITQHAPLSTQDFPRYIEFPTTNAGPVTLLNGESRTLLPGNYGHVTVNPGCTLTLSGGAYTMTGLQLESGSKVILENGSVPVEVGVKTTLIFRGQVEEQAGDELAGNVMVAFAGSNDVYLEARWIGTLIAPNAKVTIGPAAQGQAHRGAFFGKRIEVRPDQRIIHQPFPSYLITDVEVSPTTPCANQTVTVEATTRGATMAAGEQAPAVAINGGATAPTVDGAKRYVQFLGTGPRRILVSAESGGVTSSRVVEVEVQDCGVVYPRLVVSPTLKPYELEFGVTNADELTGDGLLYRWNFGDGTVVDTADPWVSHSYGGSVDASTAELVFEATLTLLRVGEDDVVVPKTIVIPNTYALMAARGFVRPPLTTNSKLVVEDADLVGEFSLRNLESGAITFTTQRIERQYCDPDRDPTFDPSESISEVLAGGASETYTVRLERHDYGKDVCGVRVQWSGAAADGVPAVVDAYFDTPSVPLVSFPLTDADTEALLGDLVTSGAVSNPNLITTEELEILKKQGKIAALPVFNAASSGVLAGGEELVGEPCDPTLADEHPELICQATDDWRVTPPLLRNALKGDMLLTSTCSVIGQMLRKLEPRQSYSHEGMMTRNYFSVIDNGASTLYMMSGVAGLSDRLNGDRVKYGWPGAVEQGIATAFSSLYMENPDGVMDLLEAFKPEAVRCLDDAEPVSALVVRPHPSNEAAVRATLQNVADWERANHENIHYRVFAYSQANISFDGVENFDGGDYASPFDGSRPAVSSTLHWYAQKSNNVSLEGDALESLLRRFGGTADEEELGAELPSGTAGIVDGLYKYDVPRRKAGIEFMYNEAYNQVATMQNDGAWQGFGFAGGALLGIMDFFTGGPSSQRTEIAGQMVSCFGLDACGASNDPSCPCTQECESGEDGSVHCELVCPPNMSPKEHAACDPKYVLSNPGEGTTVSPDNYLFWDTPYYGYYEFLSYRSGEFARVHRWAPNPATSGQCGGTVSFEDGTPVENAIVTLQANSVGTDASGAFHFSALTSGSYEVRAQVEQNGAVLWDSALVTVPAGGACNPPSLVLSANGPFEEMQPVEVAERVVSFTGHLQITDDESGADNEHWDGDMDGTCVVSPANRTVELDSEDLFGVENPCAGDEVNTNLKVICELDESDVDNERVRVTVLMTTVEGTDCNGGSDWFDEREEDTDNFGPQILDAGEIVDNPLSTYIEGGDKGELTMVITNGEGGTIIIDPILEEQRRRVVFDGSATLKDHDTWSDDEWAYPAFHQECYVDPLDPEDTIHWDSPCVDEELRAEVDITCTLSPEDMMSVSVETKVKLFEEATCGNTDLDGKTSRATEPIAPCSGDIASCPGTSLNSPNSGNPFKVKNSDEGGDYIEFDVMIKNVQQL